MNETLKKLLGARESLLVQLSTAEGWLISTPSGYIRFEHRPHGDEHVDLHSPGVVEDHRGATRFLDKKDADCVCDGVNALIPKPGCAVIAHRAVLIVRLAEVDLKIEAVSGRTTLPGGLH